MSAEKDELEEVLEVLVASLRDDEWMDYIRNWRTRAARSTNARSPSATVASTTNGNHAPTSTSGRTDGLWSAP